MKSHVKKKQNLIAVSAIALSSTLTITANAQVIEDSDLVQNCPNSHHVIRVKSYDDGKHNKTIEDAEIHSGDSQAIICSTELICYLEFSSDEINQSYETDEGATVYVHVHENHEFTISEDSSLCD